MDEQNLYAPPKANLTDVRTGKCTRAGNLVVVATGCDLPPRCIVCNAPAISPIKSKKVYWHKSWLYLLILINLFIYLIASLIARKSFKVSVGLCKEHRTKRHRRILAFMAGGSGAILAAAALLRNGEMGAAVSLFILALILLIGAAIAGRTVYPRKITNEYAHLAGCKEPFLASLEN